jgi:hypothetical protein
MKELAMFLIGAIMGGWLTWLISYLYFKNKSEGEK